MNNIIHAQGATSATRAVCGTKLTHGHSMLWVQSRVNCEKCLVAIRAAEDRFDRYSPQAFRGEVTPPVTEARVKEIVAEAIVSNELSKSRMRSEVAERRAEREAHLARERSRQAMRKESKRQALMAETDQNYIGEPNMLIHNVKPGGLLACGRPISETFVFGVRATPFSSLRSYNCIECRAANGHPTGDPDADLALGLIKSRLAEGTLTRAEIRRFLKLSD